MHRNNIELLLNRALSHQCSGQDDPAEKALGDAVADALAKVLQDDGMQLGVIVGEYLQWVDPAFHDVILAFVLSSDEATEEGQEYQSTLRYLKKQRVFEFSLQWEVSETTDPKITADIALCEDALKVLVRQHVGAYIGLVALKITDRQYRIVSNRAGDTLESQEVYIYVSD